MRHSIRVRFFSLLPKTLIAPQHGVADAGDQQPLGGMRIHLKDERQIGFGHGAEQICLDFPCFERRNRLRVTDPPPTQIHRHLVAKLAVVVRDTGDALDEVPALGAPLMQHVKLFPDESTVTVLRQRAHRELGAPHAEANPAIRPDLVDQVRHRDDLAGGRILNDREVILTEGRMIAPQQIERPIDFALDGVQLARIALNPRVEVGNRLRICRPGRPPSPAHRPTQPGSPAFYSAFCTLHSIHATGQESDGCFGNRMPSSTRRVSPSAQQSGKAPRNSSSDR